MARVSIVIPTYNRSHFLKRAIDSVIAQTLQNWELVVVDDGSADDTEEVVASYLEKDKRVRYIKQTNQGPSVARNRGISETSGEYICFLDDDDWWLPEKLDRQMEFMETHPDSGLVYTLVRVVRLADGDDSAKTPSKLATTFEKVMKHGFISPCTVMIRRSCLDQMEWFKPAAVPQEDFELWLRFSQRWKISAIEEESWTCIEENRGQRFRMSTDVVKNLIKQMEVIRNLELIEPYRRSEFLKIKICSYLNYQLGRYFYEQGSFFEAAKYFFRSICGYPLVGIMVRRPEERGLKLLTRLGKTYMAVPACLVKRLLYGQR